MARLLEFYHQANTPRTTPPASDVVHCPDCAAPLFIDVQAVRVDPDGTTTTVRLGACSGCEFAKEF